jgi:hypothetical protein
MKKAEKIRKLVTHISAGVIFAVLLVFTLQIGVQGNSRSAMNLSALTFGLFSPAVAATSPGSVGGGCPDENCEDDRISGFRCFRVPGLHYRCDDSNYPSCSETAC